MKLKGSDLLQAAMSHLDDGTDTANMSVADLLQHLQDVDVTVRSDPPRVSDASTGTEQQSNSKREEASRDHDEDQEERPSSSDKSEEEASVDHGESNDGQSLDDRAAYDDLRNLYNLANVTTRTHNPTRSRYMESRTTTRVSSGIDIRATERIGDELSDAFVSLPKAERGQTMTDRLRTKAKVCIGLNPKLAYSGVLQIITTADLKEYDIAKASHQWQYAIQNVADHFQKFDMQAIFRIPGRFTVGAADSVLTATTFTNVLTDWRSVDVTTCKRWQRWLLKWSSNADRESDAWAQEILRRTMDDELRADISSDMIDLDAEEQGAVTMFRLIIERMVVRNQEAHDAMIAYLTEFDIRLFDGECVNTAVVRIKAIARALTEEHLPKNVVRCVLKGFKKASNTDFQDICSTNIAMLSSTLFRTQLATMTRREQLFSVLDDLLVKYAELKQAKLWNGVGHERSAFIALTSSLDHSSQRDPLVEYADACAMAARRGQQLPFAEWVRNKTCHRCGKKGHIEIDCPLNPNRRPESESHLRPAPTRRPRRQSARSTNRPPRRDGNPRPRDDRRPRLTQRQPRGQQNDRPPSARRDQRDRRTFDRVHQALTDVLPTLLEAHLSGATSESDGEDVAPDEQAEDYASADESVASEDSEARANCALNDRQSMRDARLAALGIDLLKD